MAILVAALLTFQSTPPRKRRLPRSRVPPTVGLFQSTPPRKRRLGIARDCRQRGGFNPRLRARGDWSPKARRLSTTCFNPRLRARGDGVVSPSERMNTQFQSTPPRKRRPDSSRCASLIPCFNPRLRARGDHGHGRRAPDGRVSIHASAQEATRDKRGTGRL